MTTRRTVAIVLIAGALLAALLPGGVAEAAGERPPNLPSYSVQVPFSVDSWVWEVPWTTNNSTAPMCFGGVYLVWDAAFGTPNETHEGYYWLYQQRASPSFPGGLDSSASYAVGRTRLVAATDLVNGDMYMPGHVREFAGVGSGHFSRFARGDEDGCADMAKLVAEEADEARRNVLWSSVPPPEPELEVSVAAEVDDRLRVGDTVPVTVSIENLTDEPITGLSLGDGAGISMSTEHLELLSGPDPEVPTDLAANSEVEIRYAVEVLASGNLEIAAAATGTHDGTTVSDQGRTVLNVAPDVEVELSTSVTNATKVGDEFEVTATITSHESVDITGISAEPLSIAPGEAATPVSGPTSATGGDPRTAPVTLPAGGTTTITWKLRAEQRTQAELTAYVAGNDPREGSRFLLAAHDTVAIEAPGIEVTDLRLQPGSIVPGDFGNLRGTIENVGSLDVTGIDVEVESNPKLWVLEKLLGDLDPSVSPRIATLAPGERREFLIPVGMQIDAGGLAAYNAEVTFTGTAEVGGTDTEITTTARTSDALDLAPYWTTIYDQVWRNLMSNTLELFDGVNEWGDSSTLGGVAVGGGQGVLNAFQKLGDGLLTVNDVLGEASGDGGERLTTQGKAIVAAAREYLHTTSAQKMAVDLAELERNIAIGGVGTFAEWLRDIDRAAEAGDSRKLAELITEPATEVAIGFGVEKAGAQLFTKLINTPLARKTAAYLKRAPEPVTDGPDVPYDQMVPRELQDLRDMPTGVAITGETVARSGITPDEHGWMIDMAREHGVAFFVRPRPETAAKFAKLGYNAKPMAIKLKSISEIDHKWLGWDDYADSEGLVVFREPRDPFPAMKDAVERGELEWGGNEIDDIIERYNLRKAEWKSYEQPFGPDGPKVDPREGILMKLNGDTLGPGGQIIPGDGFTVQRYGTTIKTKITIDPDGVIRFTHNDKPVYSDIDLLSIAKPDGSPIDPELHRQISKAAGFGIDGQHGDSVMTSDFPNWDVAKKFAVQYANEHRRGGDPLVIIQPDVTTLGYVDDLVVPDGPVPGSDYDLFAKITTTYEGAGIR